MVNPKMNFFDPLEYIPVCFQILTKADERGISHLVPMKLWPAQKHYIQNRTHRDIILKGRQMGASTAILAANFHHLLTNPYTNIGLIAHKDDVAEFLLQTVHRFYNHLPEPRPKVDWKSASRIRFPDLDASIHIESAASTTIGRGENLNIIHLSELAQWYEPNTVELFAGITQTVSQGGFVTVESTPRGRGGFFYRLYDGAKRGDIPYKTFFYPWWYALEYQLPVEKPLELNREEQSLVTNQGLTHQQIAWRRLKIAELKDLFYQEYPENDVDCWMSSEISVFDGVSLRRYLLNVQEGKKEGNLTIWKDIMGGRNYIIGVDVGGGLPKGDFSVACVLDTKTNEHCATLRGRIAPDLFAEELVRLGHRYNNALIAVERMGHGHTVLRILLEHNYPRLYYYRDYNIALNIEVSQPGWVTSGRTRPMMIDTFGSSIRSGDLITWSENLLKEASSFQFMGQKPEAPSGEHDDELMAMMIALIVREQTPISRGPRFRPISYIKL